MTLLRVRPANPETFAAGGDDRTTMILAGDIGGTKSNLGLFLPEGQVLRAVFRRRLATRDYAGIEDLIEAFLQQATTEDENLNRLAIDATGIGVAGSVPNG